MKEYILVVIIGIIAGFIAGSLGTTTATTITMGLMLFNLVPNFATAAGTTLLAILPPLSMFAVYEYYKKNKLTFSTH